MKLFLYFSILGLSACSSLPTRSTNQVLDIPRIAQETPMWCWLATSEMALKSQPGSCAPDLDPFYQPSMVRYMLWVGYIPPMYAGCMANPRLCPFPAFLPQNFKIVLEEFSKDGAKREGCGPGQHFSYENWSSSPEKLIEEISAKRPVIAGVNLDGVPRIQNAQHAVIIIGFDPQTETITLNDPFNYPEGQDPWPHFGGKSINEGQYEISYDDLTNKAFWRVSIYISPIQKEEE